LGSAKDIMLRPIDSRTANDLVRRVHYSGKVVNNSQIHIGVFWQGKLEGALQFGPSLDKRKLQGLVRGTKWNEFIELNRLALAEVLPKNTESRALAVSFRILRKHAPHLKWIISFADATQSGHGIIYQATGFVLTGVKVNDQIWAAPTGARFSRTSLTDCRPDSGPKREQERAAQIVLSRVTATKGRWIMHTGSDRPGIGSIGYAGITNGASSMKAFKDAGFAPLPGFQLRYIYFLDPSWRQRLTVPEIPYSRIWEMGAGMYRGEKVQRAGEAKPVNAPGDQPGDRRFESDPSAPSL